jgi:hypothetical protein
MAAELTIRILLTGKTKMTQPQLKNAAKGALFVASMIIASGAKFGLATDFRAGHCSRGAGCWTNHSPCYTDPIDCSRPHEDQSKVEFVVIIRNQLHHVDQIDSVFKSEGGARARVQKLRDAGEEANVLIRALDEPKHESGVMRYLLCPVGSK